MKRLIFSVIALSLSVFVLSSCSKKEDKAIELSYSIFFPASHLQALSGVEWAEEIGKRTEGKVKITVYAGETLTKAPQVYEGVRSRKGLPRRHSALLKHSRAGNRVR